MTEIPMSELLDRLDKRGVRVTLENGRVQVKGWRKVAPDERERLAEERADVIALLQADEAVLEPEPLKINLSLSDSPTPDDNEPPESWAQHKGRTLRKSLGTLTSAGEDLVERHLATVPEEKMSTSELLFLRQRFGERFGDQLRNRR